MTNQPSAPTPQYVPISRERFAGKKWRRPIGYGHASAVTAAPVVAAELAPATLRMPLAFVQEGGRFVLMAVLSLMPGRNAFIAPDGRWLGAYVPASLRAYPFKLLAQPQTGQAVLCIDMAAGLVEESGIEGEEFFGADGNPAPALNQLFNLLVEMERSRKVTEAAVAALAEAKIIQPWSVKLKGAETERELVGLHRINEAALNKVSDEAVLKLHNTGAALAIAYAQMFSMGQLVIFEQLEQLQQQLKPPVPAQPALPENLDGLFGISNDDTIKFR